MADDIQQNTEAQKQATDALQENRAALEELSRTLLDQAREFASQRYRDGARRRNQSRQPLKARPWRRLPRCSATWIWRVYSARSSVTS
jgi:hypothetical protein